ncbi:hypothetical protein PCANB_001462 [Pneumocystis canis]|nr:hypothetical protein PCANB_001462 [Pneumocystis canis]
MAMIIVPIISYYLSLKYVFEENGTTYAAIVSVLMANAVLIGYIILALMEDRNDRNKWIKTCITTETSEKIKKSQ